MEQFRDTNYYITKDGRVWSNLRKRFLNPSLVKGYRQLWLSIDGKPLRFYIHRLVAECYIPNPNKYPYINHKNSNKEDNRIENLEWCTPQENSNHMVDNQRQSKGIHRPDAKLTEADIVQIRSLYSNTKTSYRKLAKQFNVGHTLIALILNNKIWKHL